MLDVVLRVDGGEVELVQVGVEELRHDGHVPWLQAAETFRLKVFLKVTKYSFSFHKRSEIDTAKKVCKQYKESMR